MVPGRRLSDDADVDDELRTWGRPPAPDPGGQRLGRVVRVDRGECDVITSDGMVRVASDSMRAQDEVAPVTGDWVLLDDEEGVGPLIAQVLDRHRTVSRRDPAERDTEQVLASNVDLVGIVHGLDRPLPPGRLERLLVLVEDAGAEAVVVLTKADEAAVDDDTETIVRAVVGDATVVVTSVVDGSGLDTLIGLIGAGRTLALIGASGTGKSSLVNALVGDEVLDVGEVRSADARGRHTTTARELVRLPGNAGLVLDTPGIRSIGLWEAEEALARVFGDLEERATGCRFNDCAHRHEPGCAIRDAVAAGEEDPRRVERYLALVDELASQRSREEDRRRQGKDIARRRRAAGASRRRKGRR